MMVFDECDKSEIVVARGMKAGLSPEVTIEGAVLDGFAEVFRGDGGGGIEIGDGACNFKNPVVGTGAEVEFSHRGTKHLLAG